jgi:hypothetical protein
VVICALALDYVADLTLPLSEFRRVLRPAGVLVFSIEHHTIAYRRAGRRYFDTEQIEHQSERLGVLMMHRRPLATYFGALRTTGFMVEDVREAFPTAACKGQYPEVYAKLSEFAYFLSFRARCAGSTYDGEPPQEQEYQGYVAGRCRPARARRVRMAPRRVARGRHIQRQHDSPGVRSRPGWPALVLACHDADASGPRMLARMAKCPGLQPEGRLRPRGHHHRTRAWRRHATNRTRPCPVFDLTGTTEVK